MKLIDKDALVAEIDKFMYGANLEADIASTGECFNEEVANAKYKLCKQIKDEINSLEVKEVVDLEKDVRQIIDLYLEAGKYYDDVIKKERNMYGYSDLAIKLLDRIADAKEMSIQYVLDKLKAHKGEEV